MAVPRSRSPSAGKTLQKSTSNKNNKGKTTQKPTSNKNNGGKNKKNAKQRIESSKNHVVPEQDPPEPAQLQGLKKGTKRGRGKGTNQEEETTQKRMKTSHHDKVGQKEIEGISHPSHLKEGGTVLTLGEGDTGQLGLGPDVMDRTKPAKVALPQDAIQVCAGGMHTVCVTKQGEVYTWGCNDEGALGRHTEDEDDCMEPGKVIIEDAIVQVSAGDSHTAALSDNGVVYAWGTFRDSSGSIGITPDGNKSNTPVKVISDLKIVRITSGSDHMACITKSGDLYTFGNAEQGQLGRVAECFSNRGGRKGIGFVLSPRQVHTKKRTTKFHNVWTGSYVTYALTTTGEVYSWGLNNYYQLGFDDMKNRYVPEWAKSFSKNIQWSELAGGQHHTLALDSNGKVYSLGRKEYGRLGLGVETEEKSSPTMVKALDDERCVNIACGTAVSLAVTDDGKVYAWGMGTSKQLGQSEEEDLWEPVHMKGKQLDNRHGLQVASGGQHTVILAKDKE